jgi:hypothetical protein
VPDRTILAPHPTWGMASRESDSLTPGAADALQLVARLPLAPIACLAPLLGTGQRSVAYRHIRKLAERQLVAIFAGPPQAGSRPRQLVLPTNLGLAVLALRYELDQREVVRQWRLGPRATGPLIRQLPAVLSTYELLALIARGRKGYGARLLRWQQPWRPDRAGNGRSRAPRLPACASLEWRTTTGEQQAGTYALVADTGNVPPVLYKHALAQLARAPATYGNCPPVVAIGTTSERRVRAWSAVLDSIADGRRGGRLESSVHTWGSWYAKPGVAPRINGGGAHVGLRLVLATRSEDRDKPSSQIPRPIDLTRLNSALDSWAVSPGAHVALDVISRHPFLSHARLAEVLGRNRRWARERCSELLRRRLLRVVPRGELPRVLQDRQELLEGTVAGLTLLAGSMGLSLAQAVRFHGLAGGGPAHPVGTRPALYAHLAHTLGGDAVFVRIASSVREQRNGALLEWRNAAASTHGRMRPDGYGLLQLGRREHGFLLEFDRGTIRPRALRAKFAAYQRYMSSPHARTEFEGFPAVLVVTNGPSAEKRIIDAVSAVLPSRGLRLTLLVTTVEWLKDTSSGPFGRIWLGTDRGPRRNWPEAAQSVTALRNWLGESGVGHGNGSP